MDMLQIPTIDYRELGQRIKIARIRKSYTQEYVANLVDITVTHFSNIETGRTKVGLAVVLKIAVILETSVDVLLLGDSPSFTYFQREFSSLIESCDEKQATALLEFTRNAREILRKLYP